MAGNKHPKNGGAAEVAAVPRGVQITMVVALVAGLFFVRPYLSTILFSALIAFIFNPVYTAVLKRTNRPGVAVTVTITTAILSVLVPLLLVIGITVGQANALMDKFEDSNVNVGPAQVEEVLDRGTERINSLVQALPGGESFKLDQEKINQGLQKIGTELAQGLVSFIKDAGGAFFGLISTVILAFFLITGMLRYQSELVAFLKKLSPFHDTITQTYLNRAGVMTKAMVKGQLIIAVIQGFASALSLWIVGLDYFWFFFVILTFLSFIPLGGGILTIPIGIIIMLTGNIVPGLFVILYHVLVVSNIDNILRPKLVPRTARLNPALTLLAVFSGLAVFGAAGVIYGPVVMILLITTLQMYAEYNRNVKKARPPETF